MLYTYMFDRVPLMSLFDRVDEPIYVASWRGRNNINLLLGKEEKRSVLTLISSKEAEAQLIRPDRVRSHLLSLHDYCHVYTYAHGIYTKQNPRPRLQNIIHTPHRER